MSEKEISRLIKKINDELNGKEKIYILGVIDGLKKSKVVK